MKQGYRVIDAEPHIQEDADIYATGLPEPYRSRTTMVGGGRQRGLAPGAAYMEVKPDLSAAPAPVSEPTGMYQRFGALRAKSAHPHLIDVRGDFTPAKFIKGLDLEGVDVAVFFPTLMQQIIREGTLETGHALALCQVYNDFAAEYASANPERLKWWGFLPSQDATLAAQEARRCMEQLGAVGVAMTKGAINQKLWSDEFFDPLWRELDRLEAPLGLHGPPGGRSGMADREYFRARYRGHHRSDLTQYIALECFYMVTTVCEFVLSGVLERFPGLKPVILENNSSWIPWLLWLMDEDWSTFKIALDYDLPLKPSEYFSRQCYAVVTGEEDIVKYVIDRHGDHNLLFSTDYASFDSHFPDATGSFVGLDGISEQSKRRILSENAAKLFKIQ